jgi:DUF1680 family protein
VAADYRINTYLREQRGIYVNLFIPSTLRWKQAGADLALIQKSDYPFDDTVQFEVRTSQANVFSLNFRIPAWAEGASLSLNARLLATPALPGTFAVINREWNDGDRIELTLPAKLRLEPVDPQHPQTVALLYGPLVLFAMTENQPALTRADLLGAKRVALRSWQVGTAGAPIKMMPFTDIGDQSYSTYLQVS